MLEQVEKDAKRKARAKELKKLRKAKEKKAQVHLNWSWFPVPMLLMTSHKISGTYF